MLGKFCAASSVLTPIYGFSIRYILLALTCRLTVGMLEPSYAEEGR